MVDHQEAHQEAHQELAPAVHPLAVRPLRRRDQALPQEHPRACHLVQTLEVPLDHKDHRGERAEAHLLEDRPEVCPADPLLEVFHPEEGQLLQLHLRWRTSGSAWRK